MFKKARRFEKQSYQNSKKFPCLDLLEFSLDFHKGTTLNIYIRPVTVMCVCSVSVT